MSARDEVLARIRGALGGAPDGAPAIPRSYRRTGEHAPGSARVVEQLVDRLEDYRATVIRSAADDEAVGAVEEREAQEAVAEEPEPASEGSAS